MSDNPLENSTLSQIGKIETAGPYVYTCRDGKHTVTFPDLAEMDWEQGEKFMQDLVESPESVWLKKWLPAEDFNRFKAEKLKMKELVPIIRQVSDHYGKLFGTPGEGEASRSS